MPKRAKTIAISIDPDKLSRLDRLAELFNRTRSGLIALLTDNEWEKYRLTDEGRKALHERENGQEDK